MALEKDKELESGVIGNYWKIDRILLQNGKAEVYLNLYLSEESRLAEKVAIEERIYRFDSGFSAEDMNINNPIAIGYGKLKEDEYFSDSIDV